MRERSVGIAASAMVAAMAGIYCFAAGVALVVGGNVANHAGSDIGNLVVALGVTFLVVSLASFIVGVGLWFRNAWAWAGAAVLFAAVIVANLFLSLIASNFINMVLPVAGTAVVLMVLSRPATKAAFLGDRSATPEAVKSSSGVEVARNPA